LIPHQSANLPTCTCGRSSTATGAR